MQEKIKHALQWRYAVQEFDTTKKLEPELLRAILDAGRLAPSSDGFEPWTFIVVGNPEVRQKLREAGNNQPKITEASHLVVVTYKTDTDATIADNVRRAAEAQGVSPEDLQGMRDYLAGGVTRRQNAGVLDAWLKSQTYIPLGMMIETAALLGVDGGPMEGFNPQKVEEILDLPSKHLKVATMLALGYRKVDPARPKVRQSFDEVVQFVR